MPREVSPHIMQATTMTNTSEKSIVMDVLFFLGRVLCLAPGTWAEIDADTDGDANDGRFEDKRAMDARSCCQNLSTGKERQRTQDI